MLRTSRSAFGLLLLSAACGGPALPPFQGALGDARASYPVVEATIVQLQAAMDSGLVTSAQLVDAYLLRIAAYDDSGPRLNTTVRLNPNARVEAESLDVERKAGRVRGPLHGIPIVLKDNYDTQAIPTTAGSISLAGARPGRDGFVAARLRAAGAVLLGKTNMNEFALGITTLSSIVGQTRNPYDPARYPGGSSGGTAAAVTASMAAVGWGTDTCGSIRVPAAFNALFGLRPTKGITSIRGIVPLCHSQDVSAPLARTAMDLAIALDATVGLDPADPASAVWQGRELPRFVASLDSLALRGARIGVLRPFFGQRDSDAEVNGVVLAALERIRAAGATLVEVSIPGLENLAVSASVIAYEFHADLDGYLAQHREAPVRSLREILDRGLYLSQLAGIYDSLAAAPDTGSPQYRTALANRTALRRRLFAVLAGQRLDALAYPTVRTEPSLIGDPQQDPNCEASANSGFPALSIPVGFTSGGLPVGLELLGTPLSDARLVSLGYAWERLAHPRRPPLFTPHLHLKGAPPPAPVRVVIRHDSLQATIDFIFDAPTGRLEWNVEVTGIAGQTLLALSLHQVSDSAAGLGPVIAALVPPGRLRSQGGMLLSFPARQALHAGKLYVTVLTVPDPEGGLRGALPAPAGPAVNPLPTPVAP